MDWFLYDIGLRHERVNGYKFTCVFFYLMFLMDVLVQLKKQIGH